MKMEAVHHRRLRKCLDNLLDRTRVMSGADIGLCVFDSVLPRARH